MNILNNLISKYFNNGMFNEETTEVARVSAPPDFLVVTFTIKY